MELGVGEFGDGEVKDSAEAKADVAQKDAAGGHEDYVEGGRVGVVDCKG